MHGAAGGIGIAAIQIAKLSGARVIATASTEAKRAACLQEGADQALDYRAGFLDPVKELTGGHGVDIVYDPIGAAVTDKSLRCLAYGGGYWSWASSAAARQVFAATTADQGNLEAIGVYMGDVRAPTSRRSFAANARVISRVGVGRARIRPRISHSFPLERAGRGGAGGDRPGGDRESGAGGLIRRTGGIPCLTARRTARI